MSPWRGDIDWAAVAAIQGPGRILFASLKASGADAHGGLREHWAREAPQMAASGITLVGGCHRLHTMAEAESQVEDFLNAMALIGGHEGRLVHLDCEQGNPDSVHKWMIRWNALTDSYPVLGYLPDWLESQWVTSDLASYGFAGWWASEYVPGSGAPLELLAKVTPPLWHAWDGVTPAILQYSSSALVDGVPPPCDVNVFPGTLDQLRELVTA